MLELSRVHPESGGSRLGSGWRLGYGGDTLNVALHLARFGYDVSYFTSLGGDDLSDEVCARWADDGLKLDLVLRDPERATGLYAIATDDRGERSFTYWRNESAARRMFEHPGAAAAFASAAEADVLFFSLISLAILPPEGREQLLFLAETVRANGGRVVFDGNYRPKLWASAPAALEARKSALRLCDLGLPTLEDEQALTGASSAKAVAREWRALGALNVVVKQGEEGCWGPDDKHRPPTERLTPADTSGAGDAFNAGFLSSWLRGGDDEASVESASRLAAWVIMRPGAVPDLDDGFDYNRRRDPSA